MIWNKLILKARLLAKISTMFFVRLLAYFHDGKGVWLVAEKTDEARDNGYWFYRYLRLKHPEQHAYFVISAVSPDYGKIAEYGKEHIVEPNSLKHKVLFWSSQYNTCSQPHSDYFSSYRPLKGLRSKKQVNTFLQHGITKDNLSHGLDAGQSGFDLFVTAAKREQEAVIKRHGYTLSTCILTGLCRYDNLPLSHEKKSKVILIMPTFRHWIMTASQDGIPTAEEREKFLKDPFCTVYKSLLYSDRTKKMLEKYGYTILFYPHYCAQPFLDCFEEGIGNERVVLASNRKYDVQKLLIEADVLITDFSSIFFDFAYMRKPEIFYQFDEEKYRAGHYEEGYFKYRQDAFGPVFEKESDVLDYMEKILDNGAQMEKKYESRVNDFFAFNDHNNCERIYNAIINYKESSC